MKTQTRTLSSEKVAQVLHDGAVALTKVAQERDAATQRAEAAEAREAVLLRRMEAEKVAMDMHEKGMSAVPLEALTDQLEKKAEADPHAFAVFQEAVKLTGPDMMKSASVGGAFSAAAGSSDFERYILGDVA